MTPTERVLLGLSWCWEGGHWADVPDRETICDNCMSGYEGSEVSWRREPWHPNDRLWERVAMMAAAV